MLRLLGARDHRKRGARNRRVETKHLLREEEGRVYLGLDRRFGLGSLEPLLERPLVLLQQLESLLLLQLALLRGKQRESARRSGRKSERGRWSLFVSELLMRVLMLLMLLMRALLTMVKVLHLLLQLLSLEMLLPHHLLKHQLRGGGTNKWIRDRWNKGRMRLLVVTGAPGHKVRVESAWGRVRLLHLSGCRVKCVGCQGRNRLRGLVTAVFLVLKVRRARW